VTQKKVPFALALFLSPATGSKPRFMTYILGYAGVPGAQGRSSFRVSPVEYGGVAMGTIHIPASAWQERRHRLATVGGALIVALMVAAPQAWAGGSVSFSVGFPIFAAPPVVYGPPLIYGPPVAYAPGSYYPEPAGAPSATVTPANPQSGSAAGMQPCREYQTTTTIDGTPQQSHGTACLQPDGTWRLMN
jgi:hypothetical protein